RPRQVCWRWRTGLPRTASRTWRRERSHGKGNSRPSFEADRKIDARSKTGKAPGRNTDMREPANESLLTDVSGFAPTVARSSHRHPLRSCGEAGLLRLRGLTWDIRG